MHGKSILIVDDSPTTSNLMKLQLTGLGYGVAGLAATAADALALMDRQRPDLVLMDINLGEGMNGIEAADIIMNHHGVPVIYVTSYSDDRTLNRAKESMPHGFINKPYRSNDLRVNIEIALSRIPGGYNDPAPPTSASVQDSQGAGMEQAFLSEALDHLVSGVLMIDKDLNIYYRNKSANRLLEHSIPFRSCNGRLGCTSARVKFDILRYIREKSSIVFTVNGNTALHVLIFPLCARPEGLSGDINASILFIFDALHDPCRMEDVIRTMYKLSPTEARLASKLVFNPYLSDVSASLGITYNTARTHLKRIYQKTGTSKLPSLIQKIVAGPAGLLMHYDGL